MLEIRPTCEHCNKALSYDSKEAMICTFECTWCRDCVQHLLGNICPNCGGGLVPRPIRPAHLLEKYPPSDRVVHKPVDLQAHKIKYNL